MIANTKGGHGTAEKATAQHKRHVSMQCADSSDDVISEIPVQPNFDDHDEKSIGDNTSTPEQGLWKTTPYVRVQSSDNVSLQV